jgi:hypothetical protein
VRWPSGGAGHAYAHGAAELVTIEAERLAAIFDYPVGECDSSGFVGDPFGH